MYAELIRVTRTTLHPSVVFAATAGRGAGVFVQRPVREGEILIRVPHESLVMASKAKETGARASAVYASFDKYHLAVALARGETEVTREMGSVLGAPPQNGVRLLPKHFHTPQYKQLCKTWRAMAEELGAVEEGVAESRGVWAMSHVLSRAITFQKQPTLMPVLDLLNHHGDPTGRLVAVDDDDDATAAAALCVVAARDIDVPPGAGTGAVETLPEVTIRDPPAPMPHPPVPGGHPPPGTSYGASAPQVHLPHNILGSGRIEEEVSCLRTIADCLESSFRFYSSTMPVMATANTTSAEEMCEFFDLIVSLLSADSDPNRLKTLIFDVQPSILSLLITLLDIPVPPHQTGNHAYLECRVLSVQTITKILSLCTDDLSAPVLGERCAMAVGQSNFIANALMHLSSQTVGWMRDVENIRVAYAECMFVLVMRVESLAAALVQQNGVPILFECLFSDPSVMVRNYACAILRVLAERAPERFVGLPLVERSVQQIKVEHSKYVVILLFETLSILFYASPATYLERVQGDLHLMTEFFDIIQTFLSGNTNLDVLTAVVKVIEAMLLLEGSTCGTKCIFTQRLLTQGGGKVLLQREQISEEIQTLKVRTLRKLIQACTSPTLCDQLHDAFTHFFPSLSLLVNVDGSNGGQPPPSPELRQELALTFSLLLAKHPKAREYTNQTVRAYPAWIGQLRQHLLAVIDELSPALLNGVYVVDNRGSYMNNIHYHPMTNWTDRVGIAQLVGTLFQEQEMGKAIQGIPPSFVEESIDAPYGMLSDMERKARLTHTILSHVVHASLAPGGGPAAGPLGTPGAMLQSPHPAQTPTMALHYDPMSPAAGIPGARDVSPQRHRESPAFGAPAALPSMGPQGDAHSPWQHTDAFKDLQQYASVSPERAAGDPTTPGGDRGRAKARRLRGLFGRAKSPGVNPDRRPPWNGGGNSGRKALFSAPTVAARTDFTPGKKGGAAHALVSTSRPLQEESPESLDQAYVDMAILMHLPITFGANYNRANRPTIRRFNNGSGVPYVQQTVKSNTFQSWDVKDVNEGDLYSFFIPFTKLTEERMDEELRNLARFRVRAKKGLLTTPRAQRGKRWFFYDMYHYVLGKTEVLLKELKELIIVHGTSNICFYLNIIRLMDNKEEDSAKEFLPFSPPGPAAALEHGMLQTPSAPRNSPEYEREQLLQREVLKLSNGKYKETIHGGNLLYVLERLKAYFAENFARTDMGISDHLNDIEEEIRKLEEKAARDVIGNEAEAEAEDDVESAYDSVESDDAGGAGAYKLPGPGGKGGYYEPDFSTETESDVNYNLDRMRLGDLDEDIDHPHPPYSNVPRTASPPRHPTRGYPGGLPGDDFADDSDTLSF